MSRVHLPGLAVMALAALAAVAALPSKTLSKMREHSELNALDELGELGVQLDVQDKQDIPVNREVAVQSSTPIIIARYGYPAETHTVKTADGYLLSIHRIPNSGKPVIFLQHGILSSSADWVVLGPEKSLGFLLYNAGYDVWMGNFRGNSYSRAHMKLTTKDNAFWDFSWHEMGIYDIPAVIDYILASTGQKSLVYVGHSQGTTAFLVMSSLLPEYSQKVKAFIAMAPVAFMGKIGSLPLKIIAKATKEIGLIAKLLGIGEFLPSSSFLSSITTQLCAGSSSILQGLCTNILFLFTGFDSVELDTEMLPEILQNVPAGASTKQLVHYGQLIESDKFRQYDYGAWNNLLKYGSISPPKYPLEKITTRVYLHYADNDLLAVPQGVQRLSKGLINVKVLRKVPFEKYNHVDFLYARNSKTLIYQNVMDNIQEVLQEAD